MRHDSSAKKYIIFSSCEIILFPDIRELQHILLYSRLLIVSCSAVVILAFHRQLSSIPLDNYIISFVLSWGIL